MITLYDIYFTSISQYIKYMMYICIMDIDNYIKRKGIVTYLRWVDKSYAEENGEEVYLEDLLVGYYLEDGYQVISIPMKEVREVNDRFIWSVVFSLVEMNTTHSVEELTDFMDLYMRKYCGKSLYSPDRIRLNGMISFAVENSSMDKVTQIRKFYFTEVLSKGEVRKCVMSYLNSRNTTKRLMNIENVIEWLCIEGDVFITAKTIQGQLEEDLSISTINRYMSVVRERIDNHNKKIFGTDNFMQHKKVLSIYNIKEAIEALQKAEDSLSQRNIARVAGVHYNTVNNLWDDEEVQDALNKYNESKIA